VWCYQKLVYIERLNDLFRFYLDKQQLNLPDHIYKSVALTVVVAVAVAVVVALALALAAAAAVVA